MAKYLKNYTKIKKRISLITLIVILMVMIISSTTILKLNKNSLSSAAKEALFNTSIKDYRSELASFQINRKQDMKHDIDLSAKSYSSAIRTNSALALAATSTVYQKGISEFTEQKGTSVYNGIHNNGYELVNDLDIPGDTPKSELEKEANSYDLIEGNTASNNKSKGISPISGTFISPYTYINWSDHDWNEEISQWKELGIEYVILGDTVQKTNGVWNSYYPSSLTANMYYDALTPLFQRCSTAGIKVFIGMGMDSDWWNLNLSNPEDGNKFISFCNEVLPFLDEMYQRYHLNYEDTFCGFYFVPEMANPSYFDDSSSRGISVNFLSSGLNLLIDKINALNPNMKILLSPYLNVREEDSWTTKSSSNIQAFWNELLTSTNFRDGDILCPQDSVGAKGMTLDKLLEYTLAYKRAIRDSGKQIKLWSNTELFQAPDKPEFANKPDGVEYTGTASIDRIIKQINTVAPCVERIVVFTYSNYMSKLNVVSGFIDSYTDYLTKGMIDREKPKAPNKFKTSFINISGINYLEVSFSGMYDNYGISRINVYKNGTFFTYRVSSRSDENANILPMAPHSFFDKEFNLSSDSATYEIEVVDCSGNVSDPFQFTINHNEIPNGVELDPYYYGPKIKEAPNGGTLYVDTSGDVVPVPMGFEVSSVDTENIVSKGLVIKDLYGNEFVWVPVNIDQYKNYYRDLNRPVVDESLPNGVASETEQIEKYKGFYIGRYEARYDYNNGDARVAMKKSLNATATDGVFTGNVNYDGYLWNYILSNEAKNYAEEVSDKYNYDASVKTGLPTGKQWDSTLKWIGDEKVGTSATWGNYKGSLFPANTQNYESGVLKASGSNENWTMNHIYDLAGNLSEWINETYHNEYTIHDTNYNDDNAVLTFYWPNSTYYYSTIGFRVCLFIE